MGISFFSFFYFVLFVLNCEPCQKWFPQAAIVRLGHRAAQFYDHDSISRNRCPIIILFLVDNATHLENAHPTFDLVDDLLDDLAARF